MKSYIVLLSLLGVAQAASIVLNDKSATDRYTNVEEVVEGFSLELADLRLVQLQPDQPPVWMTELEKIAARAKGVKFMDITETPQLGTHSQSKQDLELAYPMPRLSKIIKPILKSLTVKNMRENLEVFTKFRTRCKTGKDSQEWLLQRIGDITATSAGQAVRDLISVSEFPHSWGQNTIIVRINGSSTTDDAVVIIGAHQDSAHAWPFLPAPGADDDGSGTVTILEAYRGLISAGFQPQRAVEFHWYSAEEGGLLGSQAVARDYEARGINVLAMSQFDMTAWVKRGTVESVGVIVDFTDNALTEFNKKLIEKYLGIPYVETKCGYACSDHASWGRAGYPAIFTIESAFEVSNQFIHSGNDRIDISDEFSFEHMLEFAKLAAAFAAELGGWKTD